MTGRIRVEVPDAVARLCDMELTVARHHVPVGATVVVPSGAVAVNLAFTLPLPAGVACGELRASVFVPAGGVIGVKTPLASLGLAGRAESFVST